MEMNPKQQPEREDRSPLLDTTVPDWLSAFTTPNQDAFVSALQYLGDILGKRVLDFGCGRGMRSSCVLLARGAQVVGVDIDAERIKEATENHPAHEFHLIENGKIPLPDNSISVAFSSYVYLDIPTREQFRAAHEEIARVLTDNGTLVSIATHPTTPRRWTQLYRHRQEHTFEMYMHEIMESGFEIRSWRDVTFENPATPPKAGEKIQANELILKAQRLPR